MPKFLLAWSSFAAGDKLSRRFVILYNGYLPYSSVKCIAVQLSTKQWSVKPMMTYHLLPQSDVLFFVFWWNFRVNNRLPDCSVLYCTVPHCMVLCRTVLHWSSVTKQHCMPLQSTALHCLAPDGIVHNCMALQSTVWPIIQLIGPWQHCAALYGIVQNCISLQITV